MISPKKIFVIGILLIAPAFVMFMVGRSEWKQASQIDDIPESVTLHQLATGDHSNRHLFLLSDCRPASKFYSESTEGNNEIDYCWVPLYSAGQPEDDGQAIRVVAYVSEAESTSELNAMLHQKPLLVQKWGQGSSRIHALAKLYPRIATDSVIEVIVGSKLPSVHSAVKYFLTSFLCLATSLGSIFYTIVIHLDVFGKRKIEASLTHKSRQIDVRKLKNSEAKLIESMAKPFVDRGFQSLGFAERELLGSKSRQALFLSSDQRCLLAIELDKTANPVLIGVSDNGTCFSVVKGVTSEPVLGLEDGIPLLIDFMSCATTDEVISRFESWKQALVKDTTIAKILPTSAMALVHYRMLLKGWWALIHAQSHLTPDELPSPDEIIRDHAGAPTFCWGDALSDIQQEELAAVP